VWGVVLQASLDPLIPIPFLSEGRIIGGGLAAPLLEYEFSWAQGWMPVAQVGMGRWRGWLGEQHGVPLSSCALHAILSGLVLD